MVLELLKRYGIECVLATSFFVAAAWFYNGANWNQISRYDMVFSFVEPGTPDTLSFRIDRFLPNPARGINTADWARNPDHDRHYYSNKAPGPALLAIPVYFLLFHTEQLLGLPPTAPWMTIANCYFLNLAVTVLPLAFSAVLFFWLMLRLTQKTGWAVLLTGGLYFGTLTFPFATQFWGHTTALAFVVMCLYAFQVYSPKALFWGGVAAGLAVLSEYSCALIVASLGVLLVLRRDWRQLGWFVLGGLPLLLVFMGYHWICFGSPFTIANFHNNEVFRTATATGGLFHLETMKEAIWGLTFSPFRGLFYYMPVLILILVPLFFVHRLWRRSWFWIALGNVLAFFVMNITFNGWHGGATMGPRYQIPVLPLYFCLLALGLRELLPALKDLQWPRIALATGLAGFMIASIGNMLVIASVSPMAGLPDEQQSEREQQVWRNPLRFYYRSFNKGLLQPHSLVPIRVPVKPGEVRPRRTFILGEFIGLEGRGAVLPVVAFLLLAAGGLAALTWISPPMVPEAEQPAPEDAPAEPPKDDPNE